MQSQAPRHTRTHKQAHVDNEANTKRVANGIPTRSCVAPFIVCEWECNNTN